MPLPLLLLMMMLFDGAYVLEESDLLNEAIEGAILRVEERVEFVGTVEDVLSDGIERLACKPVRRLYRVALLLLIAALQRLRVRAEHELSHRVGVVLVAQQVREVAGQLLLERGGVLQRKNRLRDNNVGHLDEK